MFLRIVQAAPRRIKRLKDVYISVVRRFPKTRACVEDAGETNRETDREKMKFSLSPTTYGTNADFTLLERVDVRRILNVKS